MKRLAYLALIVMALFQSMAFAAENKIDWQVYNQTIFIKSKQQNKPVLLFVKADWCSHCQKMRETTLLDSGVAKLVNQSFIPVMIDADKDRELAKKYKVTGLPAFIVLNSQEKIVKDFTGEISIVDFMRDLSQAYRDFAENKV